MCETEAIASLCQAPLCCPPKFRSRRHACGRRVQQIQDPPSRARYQQAGGRRGARCSERGGDELPSVPMPSEALPIAMRSRRVTFLPNVASRGSYKKRSQAPHWVGWSWESPLVVRARIHAPVGRQEPLRDFALEVIREGSRGASGEEASDLSIGLPLPGFPHGVEDAPKNAPPLGGRC